MVDHRPDTQDAELPSVVAGIGYNHCGEMRVAEESIKMAAMFCNADYVKFQKQCPAESLSAEAYAAPHHHPRHSYGDTYGTHREFLEFGMDQHKQLFEWCEEFGVKYSCSVWDIASAREIISLRPEIVRVPAAANKDYEMINVLCDEYGGQLHVSLGMSTNAERDQLVEHLDSRGRVGDTVLYKRTPGYPESFDDCSLPEIADLVERYGGRVAGIGFSGHHLGFAIDNAAYALGARWFERHFTLDRTWKGSDHAASLESNGMRRLCRNLCATAQAMRPKPAEILDIEKPQRKKLKWKGPT